MRISARLLRGTALPGQPEDFSIELTFLNDGDKKVVQCVRRVQVADALGVHGLEARFTSPAGAVHEVRRPFNPTWGAPAPPDLRHHLRETGIAIAPGTPPCGCLGAFCRGRSCPTTTRSGV